MLSNAYFLAKFRFDTAENEPAKNLQNFRKMHFQKCIFRSAPGVEEVRLVHLRPLPRLDLRGAVQAAPVVRLLPLRDRRLRDLRLSGL